MLPCCYNSAAACPCLVLQAMMMDYATQWIMGMRAYVEPPLRSACVGMYHLITYPLPVLQVYVGFMRLYMCKHLFKDAKVSQQALFNADFGRISDSLDVCIPSPARDAVDELQSDE